LVVQFNVKELAFQPAKPASARVAWLALTSVMTFVAMCRALVEVVAPLPASIDVATCVVPSETPNPKENPALALSLVFPDVHRISAFGV
jgi:hypothetical protein